MATGAVAQLCLAIAMLGVAALLWGGVSVIRRGGAERRKGWLMLGVALVIFGNVLIWSWP